jgi:hypothetical protein
LHRTIFADTADVQFSDKVLTQSRRYGHHATKHNRIYRNVSTPCISAVKLGVKKKTTVDGKT